MTNATQTIDIQVAYKYTEDVIPPRCRKPRPQVFDDTLTLSVPVVSAADAPVVMRLPWDPYNQDGPSVELRGWNGDLYEPKRASEDRSNADYTAQASVEAGTDAYPTQVTEARTYGSKQDRATEIRERFAAHLVIEGKVWVRTDEPAYEVMTFGLGSNHGGTSLFLSRHPRAEMATHPVTERAAAIAQAVEIATGRGDDGSVPRFADVAVVEVLDLAYVKRPSLEDVKAAKEVALLDQIAKVKALLDDTGDGRQWYQRISAAEDALQDARTLAWAL